MVYYHFSFPHTLPKYFSKHHFRDGDMSVFQSLGGGNFTILSYGLNNTKRSHEEWSLVLFRNLIERITWIIICKNIMFLCQCSPWFVILILPTCQEFMKTSSSLFCQSEVPGLCCISLWTNPFYTAVSPNFTLGIRKMFMIFFAPF